MSFVSLLGKHNGGLYFYEYVMMSAKEIVKCSESQSKSAEVSNDTNKYFEQFFCQMCEFQIMLPSFMCLGLA